MTECGWTWTPEKGRSRGSAHILSSNVRLSATTDKKKIVAGIEKNKSKRETCHEAVSYARGRRVYTMRKPACLATARPRSPAVQQHGGCVSKSWSGCSGCARANTRGKWAGCCYTHEPSSPKAGQGLGGNACKTTTLSAENAAHTDVPSARGTERFRGKKKKKKNLVERERGREDEQSRSTM